MLRYCLYKLEMGKRLMKNKIKIGIISGILIFSSYTYSSAQTKSFNDVKNDRWSYQAISEVTEAGYISGYSDNTFKPSDNITRVEAASIINNYLVKNNRITEDYTTNNFSDVPENAWYIQAVNNVSALGIVKGDEFGRFNPDKTLSRAEMVSIINRMENYQNKGTYSFWDVNSNEWYAKDVQTAYSNGIVNGVSLVRFNPTGKVSREQFTTVIYNVMHYNPNFNAEKIAPIKDYNDDDVLNVKDAYAYEDLLRVHNILGEMNLPNRIISSQSGSLGTAEIHAISGENKDWGIYYSPKSKVLEMYRYKYEKFTNSEFEIIAELCYKITNYGSIQVWKDLLKKDALDNYFEMAEYGPYEYNITESYTNPAYNVKTPGRVTVGPKSSFYIQ